MAEDKLLTMFFEPERWEQAIQTGFDKDIDKGELSMLCSPEIRARLYMALKSGKYEIAPPHAALIPKDTPGEFRTVYINENVDRIFLSIVNNLLFETCSDMIHPTCKSYQKGIGCGKVVQEASQEIVWLTGNSHGKTVGWKSDLSKYFDSVPIEFIDKAFDDVEERAGKSVIIDVLRKYYHDNKMFDLDGNLIEQYTSLRQGSAVAAWLADVVLRHVDKKLSKLNGFYVRYSDDCLFIGKDYEKAMKIMEYELGQMEMKLNPKKVEYLNDQHWFKFLGFSIKGGTISLSSSRIKSFQKEIFKRTVKNKNGNIKTALNDVNRYLYKGDGQYSWATSVLPIINCKKDIQTLNLFVLDCIRATETQKTLVGGLGYKYDGVDFCIQRGRGKNVAHNREMTPDKLDGYYTIQCMQNAIKTNMAAYQTLVRTM